METRPEDSLLQILYYNQVKHFKPLAADVAHYLRAQWNHGPEYCFQWLWDAACRYISQRRQDYMQGALNKSLNNRNHNAAPALQGRGTGAQGKPERKGDTRQPRSATPNRPPKGGGRGSPKGTPRGRSADKGGKGKDTPSKIVCYAFQKGTCTRGRLADFLMIKVVSDLRPPSPNPLARARNNAPSSKLAPASSATSVTTYTVAAANEVLPP